MEIKFCKNRINLIHSFGISRSSNDYYDIIYIYIIDGDIIARGEAAPSKRYNESTELILSVLEKGLNVPDPSQQEPKVDLSGLKESKDDIMPLLQECGWQK